MDAQDPKIVRRPVPAASRASFEGWPLRWKVAATLVVPIVLAATFGALRIRNELSAASELGVASGNVAIVAPAVEFVDRLDGLADAAAAGEPVTEPLAAFDTSASALSSLVTSGQFDQAVAAKLATATSTAGALRDEIAAGPVTPLRIAEEVDRVAVDVVSAIATTTAAVDDSAVRPLADRLLNTLAARRALTTQQVLATAPDFTDSVVLRARAAEAAGAESAAVDRLVQQVPTEEGAALRASSDVRRDAYTRPLGESIDSAGFAGAMQTSADRYQASSQQLSFDLDSTVNTRANSLRSAALRDTAIILGAVLAALVFALGVGRSLIRSIGRLRLGAERVAQVQLPEEIERLSKEGGVPEIAALPVHTDEEVGQLARAIDDIHLQAVRLASEHGVRLQIGDMFETLSRRSRSLIEEQLTLIEALELDEDDPARLDHLFRLDHLATRMRRNGDNLLVLADTPERLRRAPAVPLQEVLRAAMSEVEDYRRVKLGPAVDGSIVGAAAGDVGHLIAELLDNALRYSPPDSSVLVTVSRAVDAGILVEIADGGLGMPAEDLHEANEGLAQGGQVTSETAKRMGLFVVGRLARRHGATVRLRTAAVSTDWPGVTASVHLPGSLIASPGDAVEPTSADAPARSGHGQLAGLLPRREHGGPVASARPEPAAPARNGVSLPKRAPGASGVVDIASVSERGTTTPDPEPRLRPPEPVWAGIEPSGSPIFERMTSEWLMDPTTHEPSDGIWPGTPTDEPADEREPKRVTRTGLPIRERGAHLVRDLPGETPATTPDERRDPAQIRDMLSRQAAGVRRGRAETDAANRTPEGER